MESSFPQKRESSCKPCIDRRSALTGTRPEDYGLSPGERLNEVITHSWSRLRQHYGEFDSAAAYLPEGEAGTGLTNDKWSLPLLRVLGFGFLPASAGPEIGGRTYAIGRFFGPVPVHLVGRGLSLDRRAARQRGAAVVNPHGLVQEFLNRSDAHLWAIVSNGLRLRQLAGRIRGSRHGDLWRQFRLLAGALSGESEFESARRSPALPALGSFLWSPESTPELNDAELANHDFLDALRHLAFTRQNKVLRPVDYRNLATEELGGVYEGLLEPTPRVSGDGADFTLERFAGSKRKRTGGFYTPDALVQCLLDSALDPVVEAAVRGKTGADAERAILDLKVCDPAVGSGHFLVGAAHRLARHLARVRAHAAGESEPSPLLYQHALRDVIGRCLYGVDMNPMAAELCRVSLWLEALEPGKPLSFLDHHIRVGNSLLGTTPELIEAGLPDGAFKPQQGDDRKVCTALRKRNRAERESGQRDMGYLMVAEPSAEYGSLGARSAWVDGLSDDTLGEVQGKEAEFRRLEGSGEYRHRWLVADAWCAAFVQGKGVGVGAEAGAGRDPALCITTDTLRGLEAVPEALAPAQRREVERLAREYQFFHWHLAFPDVFGDGDGGFDCVLGNPPWERVKLQEKEWFAERSPEIADAPNAAARKRMIRALADGDPELHRAFLDALRRSEGWSHLMRSTGRYPLCGRGDINLYAVFAEAMRTLLNHRGRAGCVLPTGIATDDTTKRFFQDVVKTRALASLFDFENKGIFFPDVHRNYKFCLFTAGRGLRPTADRAEFVFFAYAVEALRGPERRFELSPDDIALLNPNTRTCPIFRSGQDAELAKAIYRRVPVLIEEARDDQPERNPWGIRFSAMFHMANDSHRFHTRERLEADGWKLAGNVFRKDGEEYLSLYEAKMIHQFDHRWASYRLQGGKTVSADVPLSDKEDPAFAVLPRYWVEAREVHRRSRVKSNTESGPHQHPLHTADLPGHLETPLLLEPTQTFCGGDAGGNANLFGPRPSDPQSAERPRSSMQDSGGLGTQETGSLPSGEPSLVGPGGSVAERLPVDMTGSGVRSFAGTEASNAAEDRPNQTSPRWLMGWRDITRSVEKRTTIADIIPFAAVGDKFLLMYPGTDVRLATVLLGSTNSFVFDFVTRQKISGASLKYFTMKQTAVLPPYSFADADLAFVVPRVLELLYTGEDLRDFARECGWGGPPFRWDEERRFLLRCELDAAFFHLYLPADANGDWRPADRSDGCPVAETTEQLAALKRHFPTPRDAVACILDTFPGVRREDEAKRGEYRTKRVVLEIYDAMQQSIATGDSYQTRLDPPPADTRCCHTLGGHPRAIHTCHTSR